MRGLASARNASTLVIAEHADGAISQGTLSTVTAALQLGSDTTMLVAGDGSEGAASAAAAIPGVSKVLTLECNTKVAEDFSAALVGVVSGAQYSHVLAPASNAGKNTIPRVAALCDSAPLTDVQEVVSEDTFKRPMYAGNAVATVTMSDPVKFLLVRTTAFDKAATEGGSASIEAATAGSPVGLSTFVSEAVSASDRPDLGSARVVISGGRGLKSGENFAMLETLADKLGGAVGASRAAVDAGFVPNEYQVGQTGKVVAPDLYMAVGISGAIQHLSGMKDSKTIVAINKDPEAPIFQVADFGLVTDLFKAVPELNEKV